MGAILDIFGGNKARKAQERAADQSIAASKEATDRTLAVNKEMFDKVWGGTQVQRDAGDAATRMMASLMGLTLPPATQQASGVPSAAAPSTQSPANAFAYAGGGRAPMGALERRVASMGDGMVYDGLSGGNAFGTAQLGRAGLIPENSPSPQTSTATTATGNAFAPGQSVTDWLRSTPGYQFNYDEGARALNTKLAGQGRLQSGDAMREAERYGQNYGDRIFTDQFNRLGVLAGTGQTAMSQGASAAANNANVTGNTLQWNAGNLASSYGKKADATSSFWGDMSGMFGMDAMARYAGQALKGGF